MTFLSDTRVYSPQYHLNMFVNKIALFPGVGKSRKKHATLKQVLGDVRPQQATVGFAAKGVYNFLDHSQAISESRPVRPSHQCRRRHGGCVWELPAHKNE